jgi:hypothetical protein
MMTELIYLQRYLALDTQNRLISRVVYCCRQISVSQDHPLLSGVAAKPPA